MTLLGLLRAHDRNLVEISCGQWSILIPPSLNGRIFCQCDGDLLHRLDGAALQNPSQETYDNLGGNSLWPAPEGGPFAFNYLTGSPAWCVQDGISKAIPRVTRVGANRAEIEKRISLANRKGTRLSLCYRRMVSSVDISRSLMDYAVEGMCYRTEDSFEPLGDYTPEDAILAPWSLEQFPGADGILAFGKVADGADALNCDFYGDPSDRILLKPNSFVFRLGGKDRQQIGVKVRSGPEFVGALDVRRSLAMIRRTPQQDGVYFNIADNEQPDGPFSAADLYSIFNGGELDFFELETIGAMRVSDGRLSASMLPSQTLILRGDVKELLRYLSEREGIQLSESQ